MRLLLDTHALVWHVYNDPKLSLSARTAVRDVTNEVWISPASYWEIAIKVHTGKWQLTDPYPVFMHTVLTAYPIQVLPILPGHAARLIGLPDHHRDPFDRLLVAQATAEGLSLVSADVVFDQYGISRVW